MATKKSSPKKQPSKAIAKKAAVVKVIVKKVIEKKISVVKSEETNAEKDNGEKTTIQTSITSTTSASIVAINTPMEVPTDTDCMCMQKKPNGKFYNFTLQQGRWVQSSAIPFPTKEACEEACC